MDIVALLSDPAAWAALLTLIALEVVLGVDNLIFIAILSNKLPEHQQQRARRIGLTLALVMLALAFLVMIGLVLIADGFGFHVPKGYIYVAMGFSVGVEGLNMIKRNRRSPGAGKDRAGA